MQTRFNEPPITIPLVIVSSVVFFALGRSTDISFVRGPTDISVTDKSACLREFYRCTPVADINPTSARDKPFRREELVRWPLRKHTAAADQPSRSLACRINACFRSFHINLPCPLPYRYSCIRMVYFLERRRYTLECFVMQYAPMIFRI